jgi:tetratricopeptide (TPR) repeat protein
MPDLDAIEDFKILVNSLGKEPAIVAREGGTIEDVPPVSDFNSDFTGSTGDLSEEFNLEDRLMEADSDEGGDELVPDLGGFDFAEEEDNPFGDLGDFTLDDDEFVADLDDAEEVVAELDDVEEVDDLFSETESVDDLLEDDDDFGFSDLDDISEPITERPEDELPETLGDLFENGSEEAIPDFIESEQEEEEELSFDDFTLDVSSPADEIDPVDMLSDTGENDTVEDIPEFNDFDLSDDDEISLGDDFEEEIESELEELGELEPELDLGAGFDEIEDFDLSPGDFGDSTEFEDYSFGEELDAIDEMKGEPVVDDSFQLSDEQFLHLKQTLSLLPRNLKLAVEEIVAEGKMKGNKYEQLIMLLVNGSSPKDIADYLLKTINKKIKLPAGYNKKSGLALEKSKSGFKYIFTHQTWPVLRWILLGIAGLWIVSLLSLLFLYRPFHARQLYTQGYELIYSDQYDRANELFEEAWNGWQLGQFYIDGWRDKNWFYEYADAYRDRRQFIEAARKYDELNTFYPDDIRGMMDYARMETYETANYSHAEEILRKVLGVDVNNYSAMLAYGDNYFEWAGEDPSKLEDARFVYATILDDRGGKSEILLRMLRYFLRQKDDENILRLKETFEKNKNVKADPSYFSRVYSELGGYLLDKGEPAEALSILLRAEAEYDEIPDVHYQLARYFRMNDDDKMEELALRKVLFYLDSQTPLKKDKIFMKLDTHRRRGELKFRKGNFLDAENEYRQGIALYENSIIRNLIGASSTGGKLYADLGTLYYQNQDYMAALNMYDKAEDNRYITPEIEYQRGYSTYITGDYERALLEFYNAERGIPGNRNVLFALGNTMLKRENYFGAQSAFTRVINELKEEEKNIGYLQVDEKEQHKALVEMFSRAYNNLGVSYYSLARSSADVENLTLALVCFTEASGYSDLLSRDPETMVREDSPQFFDSAIAYENRDSLNILDRSGYRVRADNTIPHNIDDVRF